MILPFAEAFRGRSVFVTGVTGFKGSWLALWLSRLGAKVAGYALPPATKPNNFDASKVRELLAAHTEADIRDPAALSEALRRSAPEVVFHLAAQSLVRESYAAPKDTFEVNALGTAQLLEALRLAGRPCAVIVVTSDKCYEPRPDGAPHRETDPLGGNDPYSASKGAAEIITASYRRSFFPPDQAAKHGIRLATARAGNVIGGGDWAKDRIVTDILRALAANEPIPVRNPRSVRPWQHVLEPLSGYLSLAARLLEADPARYCEAWNFGPPNGKEASVQELVERFLKSWGSGTWVDRSDASQPPETNILRLSIDKALQQLGWKPRWSLDEAVRRTAEWQRRYPSQPSGMREACFDDLQAYEAAGAA